MYQGFGNITLECSYSASYISPTGIQIGLHMHVDKEDVKCLYKCVNSKMESSLLVAMGDGGLPFFWWWGGADGYNQHDALRLDRWVTDNLLDREGLFSFPAHGQNKYSERKGGRKENLTLSVATGRLSPVRRGASRRFLSSKTPKNGFVNDPRSTDRNRLHPFLVLPGNVHSASLLN